MSEGVRKRSEWVLTQAALDKLLGWLDRDVDEAASKYETIRRSLMKLFENRQCPTPEDLADETIDRVARRIAEGVEIQTPNPFLYFYGVALRVLQEYQRGEKKWAPQSPQPAPEDTNRFHLRISCMEECLQSLPVETREMMIEYCQGDKHARKHSRTKIAESMGITQNTLRIRVHRVRAQLEQCARKCIKASLPG